MSCRLVPKSLTSNDLERNGVMVLIFHYFTGYGSFRAHCVKVVEVSYQLICANAEPRSVAQTSIISLIII